MRMKHLIVYTLILESGATQRRLLVVHKKYAQLRLNGMKDKTLSFRPIRNSVEIIKETCDSFR